MRLLIAIPIFNERKYVEPVLANIRKFHSEILVVDDGSTDGTAELLAERSDIQVLRHPKNLGYGASLIDAFSYADWHGYDWVITIDCDEQHEPTRIPGFIKEIETDRWDLISGSRYLRPSQNDDLPPGDRRTINSTITTMLNESLHLKLTDAFCGFKAHRVSAMRKLKLTETGYAFPLQLWPQAVRAGLRITEIPVRLIYKDKTRSFGGVLDDAGRRLRHYLDVYNREMAMPTNAPADVAEPAVSTSCCCS
jgi:glycosyltransferase involved in cell wall biosynthesis